MKPQPVLPVLLFGAALTVAACSPGDDRTPPVAPVPSKSAPPPAPRNFVPKLPDANAPDGPLGRDSKASNPKGDLTSQEESTAMPKPGQTNNHSSPALDSSGPRSK
jgi:hypothetical protein